MALKVLGYITGKVSGNLKRGVVAIIVKLTGTCKGQASILVGLDLYLSASSDVIPALVPHVGHALTDILKDLRRIR